jgi:hypothetical protein
MPPWLPDFLCHMLLDLADPRCDCGLLTFGKQGD